MSTHQDIWDEATTAAKIAAVTVHVKPMVVTQNSVTVDIVHEGPCGFAWITLNGREAFTRWAKQQGLLDPYASKPTIWIYDYEQSYTKKSAHARAFAEVLRSHGITATPGSRLD